MPRSRRNVIRRTLADGTVKTYVYEAGQRTDAPEPQKPKTLGDLILEWQLQAKWKKLAPSSKALQRRALKKLDGLRIEPLSTFSYAVVARIQSHLADRPGMANVVMGLLRRMFRHAVRIEWMESNPAAEIERLETGEGQPWPWSAIRLFREKAPAEWVFILDLTIECGQSSIDMRKVRWSAYNGKTITFVRQKTGVEAVITLSAEMCAQLNERKRKAKGLTILANSLGRPWSKTGFETAWKKVMQDVGLWGQGLKFHGWRHTTGTMLADSGASEHTIASWLGHGDLQTVKRYTRKANRKRLVEDAQPRFAAEWQNGKRSK